MLEAIVQLAVRQRGLVLCCWAGILIFAGMSLPRLAIDAIPDVTNVQVSIITSAPGLSPAEVEQYLTAPVEMVVNGLPRLTQVRSTSRAAVSVVTLIFEDSMDLWFARQLVGERLKEVEGIIPSQYGVPALAPVSTALGEIYQFYLSSPSRSPTELRTLMDWEVAFDLRSVPGIIEINVMGGAAKEYQVTADPRRLSKYHITLPMLAEALKRNNINVGSGYIEKNMESYTIRGEAQFKNLDDIGNVVVATGAGGTPVLVKQIAQLAEGATLRFGAVTKHGEGEIVAGTVMMLIGENSRDVAERVKVKLDEIQKNLPPDVTIHSYYDRTEFISRMLHTVFINLAEGALLVVMVLLFTLGSLPAALIASLAIPCSMALCVLAMIATHVTGSLMSLGALDFGLLTDGAVVMLEMTLAAMGAGQLAAKDGTAQTVARIMGQGARAVGFSLAIILLVYLPLTALEGSEGRMFRPMAITVAYALVAALLFSLTAVPALSSLVLKPFAHKPGMFEKLGQRYGAVLHQVLKRPRSWCVGAAAVFALCLGLASQLGAEFTPRLEEGELLLDVKRVPSIALSTAQALGVQVEAVVATFPEVLSIVTRTGRAEVATNPVGPNEADVLVKLKPRDAWITAHDLDTFGGLLKDAIMAQVPATTVAISQPIEDTINTLVAGARSDVAIKIFGDDLAQLRQTGELLAKAVQSVPGIGDMRVQDVLGLPLLEVRPDRERLARYGLDAQDVLEVVEASRLGQHVGQVFEGSRRFDLRLFMSPLEANLESFGDLPVGMPTGELLPLAAVASIKEAEGPSVILRENMQRRVMVEINVRGRDLVGFVHDAQAAVRDVAIPQGVSIQWGGQFDNFNRAKAKLSQLVPIALGVIFVMLYLMFESLGYAAAVFVTVPLALIGGILALVFRDLPFSIPAAIGFIAVSGVSVLNGVVMAAQVRAAEASDPKEAVIAGVQHALRAVMTTSLVAAIGFVPLALSTHAGSEVQRPLATVVIGGIVSSTLMGLAILPVLLLRVRARTSKRVAID